MELLEQIAKRREKSQEEREQLWSRLVNDVAGGRDPGRVVDTLSEADFEALRVDVAKARSAQEANGLQSELARVNARLAELDREEAAVSATLDKQRQTYESCLAKITGERRDLDTLRAQVQSRLDELAK